MTNTNMGAEQGLPLPGSALLRALTENWWLVMMRGIVAIAFGIVAFVWPDLTLLTLTFLWGLYALSDGTFVLWAMASDQYRDVAPRWWLAAFGTASMLAGLLTLFWPGMTTLMLLLFIAAWSMAVGMLQIWGAIQLRKENENEWLLVLGGVLSIAFGLFLTSQPNMGALTVVWSIGWFAILAGCTYLGLALRLKKHKLPA